MAENIAIAPDLSKAEKYQSLFPQLQALLIGEKNLTANLANSAAALKEVFGFFWVGFYLVDVTENQMVLGPFQGPVACTRIAFGRGVCGTCWQQKQVQLVPDVELFPGHIACSSLSKSEVVIPIFDKQKQVVAVLDVDSTHLNDFDETDVYGLSQICALISQCHFS